MYGYSNCCAPWYILLQLASRLLPHLFPAPALWSATGSTARRLSVRRKGIRAVRCLHSALHGSSSQSAAEELRENVSVEKGVWQGEVCQDLQMHGGEYTHLSPIQLSEIDFMLTCCSLLQDDRRLVIPIRDGMPMSELSSLLNIRVGMWVQIVW